MEMTSGGIFLDGVNLENISAQNHKRCMAALFQQPVHYHASAFDNIVYGDMDSSPTLKDVKTAE
jgi:ABC-type multidrug transport system fused ATPase/permease subunit